MAHRAVQYFLLMTSCLALGQSATLPNYLSKCSLSDANLSKCMADAGNNAITTITKGDRKYKINPMNPLNVPLIDLGTRGLSLKLTEVLMSGIEELQIDSLTYDVKTGHVVLIAKIPSILITSKYLVSGQILILPVRGEGESKITLDRGIYTYSVDLKPIQKNGKEYLKAVNSDCKIDLGGATFAFENLFNGDKRLGDEVNKFINENWSEVMKEFYPAMVLVIRGIVDSTVNGYFGSVPKADVFDP